MRIQIYPISLKKFAILTLYVLTLLLYHLVSMINEIYVYDLRARRHTDDNDKIVNSLYLYVSCVYDYK
jgi:hypothetical protein